MTRLSSTTRALALGCALLAFAAPAFAHGDEDHAHETPDAHAHEGEDEADAGHDHDHGHDEEAFETGPHGGRLLAGEPISLEILIDETGDAATMRVYPFKDGQPFPPASVEALSVALTRLEGAVERLTFTAAGDHFAAAAPIAEPHSFDVAVTARAAGHDHQWSYEAYEGRTTIGNAAAAAAGVKTEIAGPATLASEIDLSGRLELTPEGSAALTARFPGRIVSLDAQIGQRVTEGETLAEIEANESLARYRIVAPMSGVVTDRRGRVGETTGDAPVISIADVSRLRAVFAAHPRDAALLKAGQPVEIRSAFGDLAAAATIEAVSPVAHEGGFTLPVHATLANPDGLWTAGAPVEGVVRIGGETARVAVRARATQRMDGRIVVFVRHGETYEARPLKLGRRSTEWVEVLDGLEPGAEYVVDGAFLIRADVEKAGAGHEH